MSSASPVGTADHPPTAAPARRPSRLIGIDLARFVAIVAMMVQHVWPDVTDRFAPRWWAVGNASTLFAVVGGMSVVLATRRYLDAGDARGARLALLARGAVVVVIGLTLASLVPASPAIDVLVYFGVAMWCTIPFLRVRTRWVAVAAGVLALSTGVLNAAVRTALLDGGMTGLSERASISWGDLADPLPTLRAVFSSGVYPVSTWIVYLLVGMIVARLLLRARDRGLEGRFVANLALVGVGLTAAALGIAQLVWVTVGRSALLATMPGIEQALPPGYGVDQIFRTPMDGAAPFRWPNLLLDVAHTGTFFDIARGVGVSLVVVAAGLAVARFAGPAVRRVLEPVRVAGAAPLTIYALHVVVTGLAATIAGADRGAWYVVGPGAWGLNVAVALIIGIVLTLVHRRGPLEALASGCAARSARLGR